jgi:hypothetical protein
MVPVQVQVQVQVQVLGLVQVQVQVLGLASEYAQTHCQAPTEARVQPVSVGDIRPLSDGCPT